MVRERGTAWPIGMTLHDGGLNGGARVAYAHACSGSRLTGHIGQVVGPHDTAIHAVTTCAGAAEWADMEAAGQLGSPLREADAALIQLAPLRPYAAGAPGHEQMLKQVEAGLAARTAFEEQAFCFCVAIARTMVPDHLRMLPCRRAVCLPQGARRRGSRSGGRRAPRRPR